MVKLGVLTVARFHVHREGNQRRGTPLCRSKGWGSVDHCFRKNQCGCDGNISELPAVGVDDFVTYIDTSPEKIQAVPTEFGPLIRKIRVGGCVPASKKSAHELDSCPIADVVIGQAVGVF